MTPEQAASAAVAPQPVEDFVARPDFARGERRAAPALPRLATLRAISKRP